MIKNINVPSGVKKLFRALQWVLIICGVLVLIEMNSPYGISINPSPSLPLGLYWDSPVPAKLHRFELACFSYAPPAWAMPRHYYSPGAQICKWVYGLPGDRIVRNGRTLHICHKNKCIFAGVILKTDSEGRPAYGADLPAVIPQDEYYFGSTRVPNSYDSRYLGLIDSVQVTRVIHPLWTQKH